MANPKAFARRMKSLGKTVNTNVDQLVRKVALGVDSTVVLATPVDTGRARSNWQVELGQPNTTTRGPLDTSGQAAIAEGAAKINQYQGGVPNASIHVTNNLPYIGKLNEGHSAQAPAGYVEKAVMVGVNAVRSSKVTVRGGVKP